MNETELYNYLKTRYLQDLEQPMDKYEAYDCYSDYGKLQIELKCRSKHYDSLILERDKYDVFMATAVDKGYAPWYVNSTPQGIYAFDLCKLKLWWIERDFPAKTEFDSPGNVRKCVTYLPVTQALQL